MAKDMPSLRKIELKRAAINNAALSGVGINFRKSASGHGPCEIYGLAAGVIVGPAERSGLIKIGDLLHAVDPCRAEATKQEFDGPVPPAQTVQQVNEDCEIVPAVQQSLTPGSSSNQDPPQGSEKVELMRNPNETGAQSGIGMTFSRTQAGPGPFMILSLTPGGAAEKSGKIRPGNLLHAVDNQSVNNLSTKEVVKLMLGPPVSPISLLLSTPDNVHAPASKAANPPVLSTAVPVDSPFVQLPQPPPPAPQTMMAFDIRRQTFIRDSNGGIGIVFDKKDPSSHYSVENLLKGGPADMSGAIQVGDLIMSVNDMPISSLSVDKVVDLIKGTPSSSVILGLATPALNSVADDMTFEVVLKRGSNGGVGIGFATRDNSLSQDMQDVGPFYVGALVPGGAAQQCNKIGLGDLIISVNEMPVHSMNLEQTRNLIIGAAGTPVTMRFKRSLTSNVVPMPPNAAPAGVDRSRSIAKPGADRSLESKLTDALKAFRVYDRDHSDFIDKSEVQMALQQQGVQTSAADINRFMDKADTNRDGRISFSEFCQLLGISVSEQAVNDFLTEHGGNRSAPALSTLPQQQQGVLPAIDLGAAISPRSTLSIDLQTGMTQVLEPGDVTIDLETAGRTEAMAAMDLSESDPDTPQYGSYLDDDEDEPAQPFGDAPNIFDGIM